MYFPDLSDYRYLKADRPLLNVGWLGAGHPVPTGPVDADLVARLRTLADTPAQLTRGHHECEFCGACQFCDRPPGSLAAARAGQEPFLGNGEIHVPGAAGVVYAAPTLLVHYIETHGYLPPREFLDAVRALPPGQPPNGHCGDGACCC